MSENPELLDARERDLVDSFLICEQAGRHEDRIPCGPGDTIIREFALRHGRADLVIFHADGSATVIEAKDGAKGYNHVVSGIGQAGLYATQLAMTKGALRLVRRALLWSSTGQIELDALIEVVCCQAGVVALPHASLDTIMAARRQATDALVRASTVVA